MLTLSKVTKLDRGIDYYKKRYPNYILAPHIEMLACELDILGARQGLVINMPPRHSKSDTVAAFLEKSLGQYKS